eukprot:TRINITY_DN10013_c0_g1_i1.p1 TRINITY_DN10013_c0_g1~~TRINITY_DN10013_c0_g1_i1.p1  ORF type:complete len:304 (-),score=46.20 TRINITY_DN10013_c0_g1_i1:121-1032(-)
MLASQPATGSNETFKLGICQTNVSKEKGESLENARGAVAEAVGMGADVVVLGEMFSCPYATKFFKEYGERLQGPLVEKDTSVRLMSDLARKHRIWLIGGSVPELDEDLVYNTCLVFNPDGEQVAKHRKVHLFDIDVAATETRPAMRFMESDVLSAGDSLTLVDLPWCRVGLGICYDVRFPEYALALRNRGAKLLVYPGAFNMTTGPAHWSLLARARAVDAQAYVAMVSPARSADPTDYQAWGHSMVVSPWGEVKVEAEHEASVWVVDINTEEVDRIREQVPTTKQKRKDLYVPYADSGREPKL